MLGISSNRKWSHNIASQSTGGLGRGRGTSRRKSEAGVISLVFNERANQASTKLLSFSSKDSLMFFAMYLLGMSSIGISVNIIGKPYQHNLYTDLAWASSSGSLHRELPVNIKVNLQIGVKHTDTVHLSQSDFCILAWWHVTTGAKTHFLRISVTHPFHFLLRGEELFPKQLIPKNIQVYSRQTGPNGS